MTLFAGCAVLRSANVTVSGPDQGAEPSAGETDGAGTVTTPPDTAPTDTAPSVVVTTDTAPPGEEGWHQNIIATYFDIAAYPKPQTAWNDIDALDENPYYFALPVNNRVPGYGEYGTCKNRWVEIVNSDSGQRAFGQWEDVGPWFVNDAEYVFDRTGTVRPFAETHKEEIWNIYREKEGKGARRPRVVLNSAGIDLSPLLAQAAGIAGKGRVNWRFVDAHEVTDGPWNGHVSNRPTRYRQSFLRSLGLGFKPWERTTTGRWD